MDRTAGFAARPSKARQAASNGPLGDPQRLQTRDDVTLAVWRWPQRPGRPALHWAHATGFHARTYTPLLDELAQFANVSAWDMRGHGRSIAPLGSFHGWSTYYDDLCDLLQASEEPLWLAGHSVGATVSLMAASRLPHKVHGLLLVEPVLIGRWEGLKMALAKRFRQAHRTAYAAGAARRRNQFSTRQEALQRYLGRGAFATWPAAWVEAYVAHAFMEDDVGVRLVCTPEWESASFAATEHHPWPAARKVRCPIIALGGESNSTFPMSSRRRLHRLLPQARIESVVGTTHFVPMERTDLVVKAARQLLGIDASGDDDPHAHSAS